MNKIIDFLKRLWRLIIGKEVRPQEMTLLNNPLCPYCNTSMGNFVTGVVTIEYDYFAGGPIGAGIHISGHGHQEYQFHYNKCGKCNYWKMYEYRETPSWWDDLWNLDCPFTSGDIIEKYKSGEINTKKYTSHYFTRW